MEHQEKLMPWRIKEEEFQAENSGQSYPNIMEIVRRKRPEISLG